MMSSSIMKILMLICFFTNVVLITFSAIVGYWDMVGFSGFFAVYCLICYTALSIFGGDEWKQ